MNIIKGLDCLMILFCFRTFYWNLYMYFYCKMIFRLNPQHFTWIIPLFIEFDVFVLFVNLCEKLIYPYVWAIHKTYQKQRKAFVSFTNLFYNPKWCMRWDEWHERWVINVDSYHTQKGVYTANQIPTRTERNAWHHGNVMKMKIEQN